MREIMCFWLTKMAACNENETQNQEFWNEYYHQLSVLVSDIEVGNTGQLFEQLYLLELCKSAIESLQVVEVILTFLIDQFCLA